MGQQGSVGARLKDGWMGIIARFGASQTLVILGLTYLFVIGPVGLGGLLIGRDLLHKRWKRREASAWDEADSAKPDLERAKLLS